MSPDTWTEGKTYESYIGRWSRPVADLFLEWIAQPGGASWLDVGCGTGALSSRILQHCNPKSVHSIDPSAGFIACAKSTVQDTRVVFSEGGAESIPFADETFDAVVSGLVLNFVPNPRAGLAEMVRVVKSGGTIAVYVWDYSDRMEMIRHFWDAAIELDPGAMDLDEGRRFPICNPTALKTLFQEAGLDRVDTRNIDVPTVFENFDDYWTPFLGGQGPAPGYAMKLDDSSRRALRDLLSVRLSGEANGGISLTARALAVRGFRSDA